MLLLTGITVFLASYGFCELIDWVCPPRKPLSNLAWSGLTAAATVIMSV